ncbi:MAG: hypothetical protein Q8L46_01365 [candidate division WWE3 bacterium]|nr:hypothetical protein [candidate division WWE3 bacterium]
MIGYYYYLTKIRPYFTQTEKADYTLLLFSLFTVLIFGVFGLRPLTIATANAYRQLSEGERYETQLTEKILSLNQAAATFFSSPEIEQLGGIVPDGHTQPQIIQALDRDAAAAGVILRSLVFHPQESGTQDLPDGSQEGKISFYTFDFFATGPEKSLSAFLQELEKDQLLQLESLQTTRQLEEGGASLEMVGRGKAFFLP